MSHTNQNTSHTFTSLFYVYLFISTNTQSQPLFFSSYIYNSELHTSKRTAKSVMNGICMSITAAIFDMCMQR